MKSNFTHKGVLFFVLLSSAFSIYGQLPTLQWSFSVGNSTGHQVPVAMAKDGRSNIYLACSSDGNSDFNPGPDTSSAGYRVVAKYDSTGKHKWSFGLPFNGEIYDIATDHQDNVYITGWVSPSYDFDPDTSATYIQPSSGGAFLAKYDSLKRFKWVIGIGDSANSVGSCTSYKMAIDVQNNIYITGRFNGTLDFDPSPAFANLSSRTKLFGAYDLFLAKYTSAGSYSWAFSVGDTAANAVGYGVALDLASNVYITGGMDGSMDFDPGLSTSTIVNNGFGGILSPFIAKYDAGGNYKWAFCLSGNSSSGLGFSITTDANADLVVTGQYSETVDFDPGSGTKNLNSIGADIFIAKYTSAGTLKWVFDNGRLGGSGYARTYSISVDAANYIYYEGALPDSADMNPGPAKAMLYSNGGPDHVFAKYSPNGDYEWAFNLGSSNYDEWECMLADANSIYVAGNYWYTIDLDPGNGTTNYTSEGFEDLFVAKYSQPALMTNSWTTDGFKKETLIYPNPATDFITINTLAPSGINELVLYDVMGKEVCAHEFTSNNLKMDLSSFSRGTYFLRLKNASDTAWGKFIVTK